MAPALIARLKEPQHHAAGFAHTQHRVTPVAAEVLKAQRHGSVAQGRRATLSEDPNEARWVLRTPGGGSADQVQSALKRADVEGEQAEQDKKMDVRE